MNPVMVICFSRVTSLIKRIGLRGQAVKTSPFHGGNTGSIPVGVIKSKIVSHID